MKLLLLLLLSISIFATGGVGGTSGGPKPKKDDFEKIGPKTPWSEIQDIAKINKEVKIAHTAIFVSRPLNVFDVCVDGDEFRSVAKVPKYKRMLVGKTHFGTDEDGYKDVKIGNEFLRFPINYTKYETKCENDNRRCRRVKVEVNRETIKELEIKKVKTYKPNSDNPREVVLDKKRKDYVIPYCN